MPTTPFKLTILGLGLMGGSFGYALHGFRHAWLTGYDLDESVADLALERGVVHQIAPSPEAAVAEADLTLLCSSPESVMENMNRCCPHFKPGSVVTDICGIKRDLLAWVQAHFPPQVDYIGLHPMAGKEVGGLNNAEAGLFRNTGFLIVTPERYREDSLQLIQELSGYVGAGRVVINQPREHDDIIAYTSDLMHISATALCESFPENMTMAHTAGAFRDCTRIAKIDPDLWTELLTGNAANILPYLSAHITHLSDLKTALERADKPFIHAFLQTAAANKEKMGRL